MVFPIVSTHIKKDDKWIKSARTDISPYSCRLLSTVFIGLICLSACARQEDASAQLTKKISSESNNDSQNKSNKSLKSEFGSTIAGQAIFERANCAMCHPGGNNTMDPGHPIKGQEFARKYAQDAFLESTIRKGFPEVGMPSFGKGQINDEEMKDLIAYVRSLTAPAKVNHQPFAPINSPAVKSTQSTK